VEASFFLDFLDTFSSRKKYQMSIAKGKNKFLLIDTIFPVHGVFTNHQLSV